MADGFIQHSPDSSGKKVDTSELTVGANTVERQRMVIADDTTAVGVAKVAAADPASTDYGLAVRPIFPAQGSDGTTVAGPVVQAVVNDTIEQYTTGTVQPLSMTSEGRIRVSMVQSNIYMELFDDPDSMGGDNPSTSLASFAYNTKDNPWGM